MKRLEKLQVLVVLAVESVNSIIKDKAKLNGITDSMKTLNDDLIKAHRFQQNIYTKLQPRVELIHSSINENKNLTGKTHIELGITYNGKCRVR